MAARRRDSLHKLGVTSSHSCGKWRMLNNDPRPFIDVRSHPLCSSTKYTTLHSDHSIPYPVSCASRGWLTHTCTSANLPQPCRAYPFAVHSCPCQPMGCIHPGSQRQKDNFSAALKPELECVSSAMALQHINRTRTHFLGWNTIFLCLIGKQVQFTLSKWVRIFSLVRQALL
jgi:hypothetical protein